MLAGKKRKARLSSPASAPGRAVHGLACHGGRWGFVFVLCIRHLGDELCKLSNWRKPPPGPLHGQPSHREPLILGVGCGCQGLAAGGSRLSARLHGSGGFRRPVRCRFTGDPCPAAGCVVRQVPPRGAGLAGSPDCKSWVTAERRESLLPSTPSIQMSPVSRGLGHLGAAFFPSCSSGAGLLVCQLRGSCSQGRDRASLTQPVPTCTITAEGAALLGSPDPGAGPRCARGRRALLRASPPVGHGAGGLLQLLCPQKDGSDTGQRTKQLLTGPVGFSVALWAGAGQLDSWFLSPATCPPLLCILFPCPRAAPRRDRRVRSAQGCSNAAV